MLKMHPNVTQRTCSKLADVFVEQTSWVNNTKQFEMDFPVIKSVQNIRDVQRLYITKKAHNKHLNRNTYITKNGWNPKRPPNKKHLYKQHPKSRPPRNSPTPKRESPSTIRSTPRDTAGGSHVLNNSESLGSKFTTSRFKVMKPKPNLRETWLFWLARLASEFCRQGPGGHPKI